MNLTIVGQVPSQKNSKKMTYINGRQILYTSANVKQWQESAAWQLKNKSKFMSSVKINYIFYVKDNRRRDLDNMIASVNDALVKAKIIPDDCWQNLEITGARAEIDKTNPRVDVFIESKL